MNGYVLPVDWYTRRDLHNILFHKIEDYSSLREKIRNIDATPVQNGVLFLNEPERTELVGLIHTTELERQSTENLRTFKQRVVTAKSQAASSARQTLNYDSAKYGYLLAIDAEIKSILRNNLLPNIAAHSSLRKKIQDIVANEDQRGMLILNESERAQLLKLLPKELGVLKESLQLAQLQPLKLITKAPLSLALPSMEELEEGDARFNRYARQSHEEQKQIPNGFFPADHFFKFPVYPLDGKYCCLTDGSVVKSRQRKWFVAPDLYWRWKIQGRRKEIYYTSRR
jgi:hypothetical protein